ncbi:MAG: hypothetical protein GEU73_11350 [Chloroflexi bacterium]|nr:hypothetical protein [Chloroflexota bacterium]
MTSDARRSIFQCTTIAGAVVEIADPGATRAFYEIVFADAAGRWVEEEDTLTYRAGSQTVEFVRAAGPRAPGVGRHIGYHVRRDRLPRLVEQLAASGHGADWWREDRQSERDVSAYLRDPDGNCVQLVATDFISPLVEHVTIEVHDLETADVFYVKALGGTADYYHGRRVQDYMQAAAWGEGRDPCAPWTRLWPGPGLSTNPRHTPKASHPNQQLFVRFGPTVLGAVLAPTHQQEPPEELVTGTPRVLFRTAQSPSDIPALLASPPVSLLPEDRIPLAHARRGQSVFMRDPGGNFVEIQCAAS